LKILNAVAVYWPLNNSTWTYVYFLRTNHLFISQFVLQFSNIGHQSFIMGIYYK